MTARLDVTTANLANLDDRPGEVLVSSIFADQRPVRGLAGFVDWRLCGRISGWLMSGFVTGEAHEHVLYPPRYRLAYDLVLLVGLGKRATHRTERLRQGAEAAAQAVVRLGRTQMTCDLFGLETLSSTPTKAAPELVEMLRAQRGLEQITLAVQPDLRRRLGHLLPR